MRHPAVEHAVPGRLRCLDCAAVLYTDPVTGALVDAWGERTCSASYRAHAPDLPELPVRAAGPATPATRMPDRLRRAAPLAGAGAVPDPPLPHQGHSAPGGSVSLRDHLTVALDAGDPAGPVPGALRAGAQTTPARPRTGPATPGGAS